MCSQDGRASYSERASRLLLCRDVGIIRMMGSRYESHYRRGPLLPHYWDITQLYYSIVSSLSFVTIVLLPVLCVCSTVLCALVCSVAPPHHFAVGGLVRCMLLSVHPALSTFVPSYVAFCTKLQVNNFLQGGNDRQPENDGANTTASKDKFCSFQQVLKSCFQSTCGSQLLTCLAKCPQRSRTAKRIHLRRAPPNT